MIHDPIDQEILLLCRQARTRNKGFELLMTHYQKTLYWRIRSLVKSHENTDDVMQNTIIKVFKYIDRFESRSSLMTWLFKIATNESLTFLAKQNQTKAKKNSYTQQMIMSGRDEFADDISASYIEETLQNAIEALPKKQQQVFRLRYFEEMTYKVMSDTLSTSEGALKASYHHAAKKVEQFVLDHYEG